MSTKKNRAILFIIFSLPMMVFFQNCSQTSFAPAQDQNFFSNGDFLPPGVDIEPPFLPSTPGDPPSTPPVTPPVVIPQPPSFIEKQTQFIIKSEVSKVDVLIVVDKSGSMEYEQASVAYRFQNFISKLNNVDWRLAITTTDATSVDKDCAGGRLLNFNGADSKVAGKYFISSADNVATAQALFSETIQRPQECGNEEGLKASLQALQREQTSNLFLRSDAALHIVVLTDSNSGLKAFSPLDADNLLQYVAQAYQNKVFKFHSIIVKNKDVACRDHQGVAMLPNGQMIQNQNENFGTVYEYISDITSGIIGDVCSADYAQQLQDIGASVAVQTDEIVLECAPVDKDQNGHLDIEVRRSDNSLISNYKVESSHVKFDQALVDGTYTATYTCISDNTTKK